MRNELAWGNIESVKGVYRWNLTTAFLDMGPLDYDGFTLGMRRDNVKVLWILGGCGPPCNNPLYSAVDTLEGRAAFAAFAVAAALHFEQLYPGGVALELWNEPLMGSWKADTNRSAGPHQELPRFNDLAIAVGQAMQAHAPDTPLMAPGAFPGFSGFMQSFASSGALRYLDAVSVHPYRNCDWPEHGMKGWATLRQIIDAAPDGAGRGLSMVSSEWGYSALWPTAVMRQNAGDMFDPASPTGCDEELTAKFLPRQWLSNLLHNVTLSIWFQMHDGPLAAGAGADQSHFGIVRAQSHPERADDRYWSPKRGYYSAQTFTRILQGRTLVDACVPSTFQPQQSGATACDGFTVSGAAANVSFVLVFDTATKEHAPVIVVWCTDVTRLPCALKIAQKPGATGTWNATTFSQISFTGDTLDTVTVTGGSGVLDVFADNAPTYLQTSVILG